GLDGLVEMFVGEFFERIHMLLKYGVVDENVELAKGGDRFRHCILAEFRVRDVPTDQQASPSLFLDGVFGFPSVRVLRQIDNRDISALAGKQHRDTASNA